MFATVLKLYVCNFIRGGARKLCESLGPTSWSDPTSAPSPSLVEATTRPGDQAEANNRNQITFKKFNQFKRFVWQRGSGKFSLVLLYCIRKKVVFFTPSAPSRNLFFLYNLYTVKGLFLLWYIQHLIFFLWMMLSTQWRSS